MATARVNEDIRYEADERCPPFIFIGVGLQGVMLALAPAVVQVAIVVQGAGQSESYLSWAVFSALVIYGVITALQAARFRRLGTGHVLITGASGIFIAISITALVEGGPAMLASLIVASSILQFALAAWLPLVRRIITPVVSGTVVMLLAFSVALIGFDKLNDVPADAPPAAAPIVAAVTLVVATALALRASGGWRLWSPLIGVATGCAVASFLGLYDVQRAIDAPWVDVPGGGWPGFDLTPGAEFWALLPAFVITTLVLAINSVGDGIVIQPASRRRPRATDFRVVQGAVNTNGLGVLLSGVAGTLPTMGYPGTSTALIGLTGVAARNVGYVIGAGFVALAFVPKITALVVAIPGPVVGVYIVMLVAILFVAGIRMVVQEGPNIRNTTIVGLAFWIGVGAQNQAIFGDLLRGAWGVLINNGIAAGAFAAILLTSFLELTSPRRRRLETELDFSALPEIDAFLRGLASKLGWNEASTQRLRSAGEETLSCLLQPDAAAGDTGAPENAARLIVVARPTEGAVEMEFMAVFEQENLEDRLAYLSEQPESPDERDVSFRLLRHYASSVRHRKYHGVDIVTVQVEGSR